MDRPRYPSSTVRPASRSAWTASASGAGSGPQAAEQDAVGQHGRGGGEPVPAEVAGLPHVGPDGPRANSDRGPARPAAAARAAARRPGGPRGRSRRRGRRWCTRAPPGARPRRPGRGRGPAASAARAGEPSAASSSSASAVPAAVDLAQPATGRAGCRPAAAPTSVVLPADRAHEHRHGRRAPRPGRRAGLRQPGRGLRRPGAGHDHAEPRHGVRGGRVDRLAQGRAATLHRSDGLHRVRGRRTASAPVRLDGPRRPAGSPGHPAQHRQGAPGARRRSRRAAGSTGGSGHRDAGRARGQRRTGPHPRGHAAGPRP